MSTTDTEKPDQTTNESETEQPTPAPTSEPESEADSGTDNQQEPAKGVGAEAAKYRVQLREAEADRDRIAQRYEELTRQIIEEALPSNVSEKLFWTVHDSAEAFLSEEGRVNAEAVSEAAKQVAATYGIPSTPRAPGTWGMGNMGSTVSAGAPSKGFEGAFEPKRGD